MEKHIPVMLNEVISQLPSEVNGTFVDLTLGRGGHSAEILKRINKGLLISFDKDISAIKESASKLKKISGNFKLIHSDYKNIKNELDKEGVNSVQWILADLGVSSPQLDNPERGFSYMSDAKLDMRMDQSQDLSAYEIVNDWVESDLIDIFRNYGDVKLPNKVAKAIVQNRPIRTTKELVHVIRESLPAAIVRKKNPAKAVFQAIRIAVNDELSSLKTMLKDASRLLSIGGKLLVITFHSIEDRIVKNFYRQFIQDDTGKLPIIVEKKWSVKTIKPSNEEVKKNRRSRSAKLRVLTKIG